MSGTVGFDRGGGDDDLVGRGDAAAVLREQLDAEVAKVIELGGQPRLVEAAVRPRDAAPRFAARIIASGIIPDPPIPTKKAGSSLVLGRLPLSIAPGYSRFRL